MRADLHLHSYYSDGKYPPEELARRAFIAGVKLFSVTDHDSMSGNGEKLAAANKYALTYVPGWEISAYEEEKVHILGYGCECNGAYEAFLQARREGAVVRARDMWKKANAYFGLAVPFEEVEAEHAKKEAPLHGMHVVRAFAKRLCVSEQNLFRSCFSYGKVAYSALCRPLPEEAIEIIHETGGIASLAHPGRLMMSGSEKFDLFKRLVAYGLDGIECVYTTHTLSETEEYRDYARSRGLLVTGGSDFHAEGGSATVGQPVFEADETLLAALNGLGRR